MSKMESHHRTLGILHIIYGSLVLSVMILIHTLIYSISPFIFNELGGEYHVIIGIVAQFGRILALIIVLVVPLPAIIGGVALSYGKPWGLTVVLVAGSVSLLSFPIGTALGAYTIWVFVFTQGQKNTNDKN